MAFPLDEMIDKVGFVHLHLHTSFSLREGALPLAKLLKLAEADGQPALAVTDTNNLFGALEFSEKLAKSGIQPIIGIQLAIAFGDGAQLSARLGEDEAGRAPLVLLAQDEEGYLNLMHLASRAWLDPTPGEPPHISFERLAGRSARLIALTGGPNGPLDVSLGVGRQEVARARLERLMPIFDRRLA